MNFIDQWQTKLNDSYAEFAELAVDAQDIDFTHGLVATAVLWPVRDALHDDEGYDALFDLCGPKANQIFKAIRAWDKKPKDAARSLADQAHENEKLRAALSTLVEYFEAVPAFTEHLAQIVSAQQGGGDVYNIAGQIKAALVNIGGTTTIQSLNLQLTAKVEIPPAPQPTRPPEVTEFVGRETELAYYVDKLTTVHLAVLSGMAGVGKTTLAAVLARQVIERDKIFWHSFHEREGIETIIWKLASFLAWHGQGDLWQMLQNAQQTGGQAPPPETIFDYLFQMIKGQNYLLCFDDFQFVDDDPRLNQLVERLREAVFAGELAIVITSRRMPEFVKTVEFEALGGLSAADTQRLLSQQGVSLPDDLAADLYTHTGGNAQFLTLAIDALQQDKDPARLINNLSETDDIERYLMNEVDESLTGDERAVMGAVAVLLGYPGTRDVIETILDRGNIRRSLRQLSDRHLLVIAEGESGKEYSQHAVVQGFYYDLSGRHQRRTMHRRAAEYYHLEELDLLKAALHYERAGEYAQAAKLATQDVRALINQGQARVLRSLLERFEARQLEPEPWAKVNLARGQVYALLGERQSARESYQEALSQTALPDTPVVSELKARVCLGMGELLERETPQEALEWLQRGLAEVPDRSRQETAALYIQTGTIQMAVGNYPDALSSLEQGLAYLPQGPSQLRSQALMNLGAVYIDYQGDIERSKQYNLQALEISQQLHDDFLSAQILDNLGISKYISGDWLGGIADFKQALELAERLGSEESKAYITGNLGAAHIYIGDDEAALNYLENCISQTRKNNLQMAEMIAQFRLADLRIRQKAWALAEPPLREAERLALAVEAKRNLSEIYSAWAEIKLALGAQHEALEYAERSLQIARDLEVDFEQGFALRVLGQVHFAMDECQQALTAFEQSLFLLAEIDPYEAARTKMQWGLALLADSDVDQGRLLLQEACSTYRDLGAKRDLAAVEELLRQ